jgi:transposase-like protein
MVQVRDLTELTLFDRWSKVKDEDVWWSEIMDLAMRGVKRLLESAMEQELLEELHAGKYRRTEQRRGYRNGYRHRGLSET